MRIRSSLLVLSLLLSPLHARAAGPSRHAEPAPAPAFALPTRAGTTVASDSLRGRVVLLDFWASWCGPCHASFPWMAAMHDRWAAKGLTIVAVGLDKRRDLADAFLAGQRVPFTVAFDPSGATAERYHVAGMPTSVLIDRDGTVRWRHVGFDAKKTSEAEALIREACAR